MPSNIIQRVRYNYNYDTLMRANIDLPHLHKVPQTSIILWTLTIRHYRIPDDTQQWQIDGKTQASLSARQLTHVQYDKLG